ncbi:hypothetical protein HMPREF9538_01349 [Klebsiella sp. MS 92-3]|nr:hypothetical protein HMPREF9538_01349 [Klebsiella sp. MS 92-3]
MMPPGMAIVISRWLTSVRTRHPSGCRQAGDVPRPSFCSMMAFG